MRILFILFFAYVLSFASIGQIVLKNGNVYIKRAGLKIEAKNGSAIEKSDIIVTGEAGNAQIKFIDGTVITIGIKSTFKIEDYFNDNKAPRAKFKFLRGTFKSITGKIGHIAPKSFKLQTRTATIGIRGTVVLGKTTPKGDIIACLSGLIAVRSIGIPKAVVVKPGHFTGVKPGTPPSPPKALTPKAMKQLSSSLKVGNNKEKEKKSQSKKKNKSGSKKQSQKTQQNQESKTESQQNSMINLPKTTTTPEAASEALSKNKNDEKTQDVEKVVKEKQETCPEGTTGTYPNCGTCDPETQTGTYPNCVDKTCPEGTTGTYPDCGTCAEDQIGTYPNCISRPPDVVDINSTDCSELITGAEPNCTSASETLHGQLIFVTDNNTTFSGYQKDINYTYAQNTLSGNNILNFFDNNLTPTSLHSTDINWSATISEYNVSTSIPWDDLGTVPLSFYTPDGNATIISSKLYADSKREFFILYALGYTNSDAVHQFGLLQTAGKYAQFPSGDNLIHHIIAYKPPYIDIPENFLARLDNKNFIYILPNYIDNTEDRYLNGVGVGRIVDDNGKAKLSGYIFGSTPTYSATTDMQLYGHLYGSDYQGFDLSGMSISQNENHKIKGVAGYSINPFYSNYTGNIPTGTLSLTGYADAILANGDIKVSDGSNFNYSIDRATGYTKNGSINFIQSSMPRVLKQKLGVVGGYQIFFQPDSADNIKSAYLGEDNFATLSFANGKGWLLTLDDNFNHYNYDEWYNWHGDNYISWGLFSYNDGNNPAVIPSPWVAGTYASEANEYINNAISHNISNVNIKYEGLILGYVLDNGKPYTISLDNDNYVKLAFDFGSKNGLNAENSYISFYSNNKHWNLFFEPSEINSGDFALQIDRTKSSIDDSNGSGVVGSAIGNFYGPQADSVAGSINANSDDNKTLVGVFSTSYISYADNRSIYFQYPDSWSVPLEDSSSDDSISLNGYIAIAKDNYGYFDNFGTIKLDINGSSNSIGAESKITTVKNISGQETFVNTSLQKESNVSTMTYFDINHFAIKDFNSSMGWLQTDSLQNSDNDYVSWGYWEKDPAEDSTLSNEGNFWVAGKDAQKANAYITSLIAQTNHTNYTYNGNVLGVVKNENDITYKIDPQVNNDVRLHFDFGGGVGALKEGSYIKFQTKENTPQSWEIDMHGSLSNGSFNITDANNVKVNGTSYNGSSVSKISSSNIKGSFYGDKAQAVGGVFKAKIPNKTAIGVFKAKRDIGGAD